MKIQSVCASCFTDYAIQDFIRSKADSPECSYCGASNETESIAAPFDDVRRFIASNLNRHYDTPENCLPWDSAEGGWQGIEPTDAYDLFWDLDLCSDSTGDLFNDLVHAFNDRQFVTHDPFGVSRVDGLKYSWESFCEQTKHKMRYVIFRAEPTEVARASDSHSNEEWDEYAPPYRILLEIGEMVRRHRLMRVLPAGTSVFRARQHEAEVECTVAADLGSPPSNRASQSRMSPAGISMFYGANDETTALAEILSLDSMTRTRVTFGQFQTTRGLTLLDLTEVPSVPSLFDRNRHHSRPTLIFLNHFSRDISSPIERDGREHYEYVPTQIIAEYFRHVFRDADKPLDGIMFRSSRTPTGICYCFFADSESCTVGPTPGPKHMLVLISHWSFELPQEPEYHI